MNFKILTTVIVLIVCSSCRTTIPKNDKTRPEVILSVTELDTNQQWKVTDSMSRDLFIEGDSSDGGAVYIVTASAKDKGGVQALKLFVDGTSFVGNNTNEGDRAAPVDQLVVAVRLDPFKVDQSIELYARATDYHGNFDYTVDVVIRTPPISNPSKLAWNTPITLKSLGTHPHPQVKNKTLKDIVSSRVIVRGDGKRCSDCHYRNVSGRGYHYRPPIAKGATDLITPYTKSKSKHRLPDGYITWKGEVQKNEKGRKGFSSLAGRFLTWGHAKEKPRYLADVIRKWIDDGRLE